MTQNFEYHGYNVDSGLVAEFDGEVKSIESDLRTACCLVAV
jgi:hypothetical protein